MSTRIQKLIGRTAESQSHDLETKARKEDSGAAKLSIIAKLNRWHSFDTKQSTDCKQHVLAINSNTTIVVPDLRFELLHDFFLQVLLVRLDVAFPWGNGLLVANPYLLGDLSN